MPRYAPEPAPKHGATRRTAVLLVNLGTPDETRTFPSGELNVVKLGGLTVGNPVLAVPVELSGGVPATLIKGS